ncbi:MAG: DUF2207 domain-containing protein [Synergistaceae bacterium]|nr:DUF2207 domain-containing protein [Synergistaceae bacterium]
MKKVFSSIPMFVVLLLLFAGASCASANEVLKKYDAHVRINQDSSLEVTETIVAKVENVEIQRGIIRTFPVEYRDDKNKTVEVGFNVTDVRLDGSEVPWQTKRSGRSVDLRIGDPDRIIAPGVHTFTIKYTTTRQIGFFEDHDELYWNVTGTDWTFPIIEASCSVALPGRAFGEGFNTIEWYVGEAGTKGDIKNAKLTSGNSVITTRALGPGEGLTVVYTWPKGLVTPPPPPLKDNETAQGIVGTVTLALMLCWFWYAWRKWGKDPIRRAVIPIFYPPKNTSPAFLRYVRDMMLDQTAFTSAVLGLAVKGALGIEEEDETKTFFGTTKGNYILHKTDIEPENLEPEEKALMMQLFPGSIDTVELTQANRSLLSGAMASLGRNFRKRNSTLFTKNTDKVLVGVLIYALGTAALYPFSGEYPINVVLAGVCGVIMIALGMRLSKAANSGGQNVRQLLVRIFPPVLIGAVASIALTDEGLSPLTFLMFAAAALVISVMRPLMVARTKEGSDLLSDIEGLKLYMDTAEKERLEMFNPPEETPQLFELLLPYALALDVAKTWGNRFEKVLTSAQYRPQWYTGPSPYIFMYGAGLQNFSSDLQDHMKQSLAAPAPGGSSGMGGGGFVGGGGGGGGGRGW